MAPWLALLFATLSALGLAQAGLSGSLRALVFGLADALLALGFFAGGVLPW
ncbi:hypothetical protein MKK64_17345 [Methylobacterium sp. E-025]|uniref:hypothetical protein n=1 Tax=Methylobacterium sp. E-025 TaxID=2836561 RepID=UPI001FB9A53A|nr:hypothetical protein [Methylobacterium sp. E-025]MCJ2112949.1 hypothetical protein [Methylobacterium sp. E-025]